MRAYQSIVLLPPHLRLGHASCLFPSGFPNNILYAFLTLPSVLHVQFILLDLITLITLGKAPYYAVFSHLAPCCQDTRNLCLSL